MRPVARALWIASILPLLVPVPVGSAATGVAAPARTRAAGDAGALDLPGAQAAMAAIRPEAIEAHMRFLADGLLEGRAPGGRGYAIAARYVVAQMEATGLQPAGSGGGWYQEVPLRQTVLDAEKSSVVLARGGREEVLVEGTDYTSGGDLLRTDTSVEAPLLFAGFGVTAPDQGYDDFAGVDARGRILVVLGGAPPTFPSTLRAHYSNRAVKARNAVAHGAIGVLGMATPEAQRMFPWDWSVPQARAGRLDWLTGDGAPHDVFPELRGGASLSPAAAERLFAGAPKTLEEIFAAAAAGRPQSFPLAVEARLHLASRHTEFESPNVVGLLRGSDPALRDQYVVFSAHIDHLGHCDPRGGDDVCHGAVDNASGVASLLEVARAFAALPKPPRRSILFAFVTGEEKGLLGSDYFARFPTVPKSAMIANINIDGAVSLIFPTTDVVGLGMEHSTLARDVEAAARILGYSLSPDPEPEEMGFIRNDAYSFVRQGVPAVILTDGGKSADPKIDHHAAMHEWETTRYHLPLDDMRQPLDFAGAARGTRLQFLTGYGVAERADPPAWNPDDFFGKKYGAAVSASGGSSNR